MSKLEELIAELCPDGVEFKNLGDILKICNGRDYKNFDAGNIPVYGSGGIMTHIDNAIYDKPSVLIPRKGSLKNLFYVENPFWTVDTIFYTKINPQIAIPKFVYFCLQKEHLEDLNQAGGVPSLTQSVLNELTIPIPPLEIQKRIVQILDKFSDSNNGLISLLERELILRKKQYEFYRDQLLTFDSDVEFVTLREIGKVSMCKRIMKSETSTEGDVPFYKIGTFGKAADAFISKEIFQKYKTAYSYPKKGDILISASGTIGRTVIFDGEPAYFQDSNIVWLANDETKILNAFLFYWYQTNPWKISTGGTISRLYNDNIAEAKVPLISIEEQKKIVATLERFDKLCNDLTSGIPAEIQARQKQYEFYRDKLLTFKERSGIEN